MADLIPEEAIESAARLLTSHNYDGMGADHQRYLRARAIQALEAAAPLILAAGLERLADEIGASATLAHESAGESDDRAGVVAAATLSTAARLRRRASVLRGEGNGGE